MKNYISMFIMIIVGFVLQTTIFRSLQIADVSPNILVILTAIAGTMYGQYNGLFTGVVCGLFIDLMYSSVVGVNIFIYAVIGFIMGITNKVYIEDDICLLYTSRTEMIRLPVVSRVGCLSLMATSGLDR